VATIGVSSGKWYFEVTRTSGGSNDTNGVGFYLSGTSQEAIYRDNAEFQYDGSINSYGASWSVNGVVIGVALDLDNTSITLYKDGVSQGVAKSNLPAGTWVPLMLNRSTSTFVANFGQRAFAYTAPSGYKSLNTANLPEPTIVDGSKYFDTKLWTGTGSSRSITGYSFSPDWVWIKKRSGSTSHNLFDAVRGANKPLFSDLTNQELSDGRLTAFNSDGFTLDSDNAVNDNNQTHVGWAWDGGTSTVTNNNGSIASQVRANQSAGFSIATFTSPSSGNFSFGHDLNAAPEFVLVKTRGAASDWSVYHASVVTNTSQYLVLNSNAALATYSTVWGSALPTSSVVSLTSGGAVATSQSCVAYCFAPVAGYSQIGSFSPNGTTDNAFVYTGFRTRFILAKFTTPGDWMLLDTSRRPNGPTGGTLIAQDAAAEDGVYSNSQVGFDFLSNGFKIRHSGAPLGDSGKTVIYYAVAENPFQANGGLAR